MTEMRKKLDFFWGDLTMMRNDLSDECVLTHYINRIAELKTKKTVQVDHWEGNKETKLGRTLPDPSPPYGKEAG